MHREHALLTRAPLSGLRSPLEESTMPSFVVLCKGGVCDIGDTWEWLLPQTLIFFLTTKYILHFSCINEHL